MNLVNSFIALLPFSKAMKEFTKFIITSAICRNQTRFFIIIIKVKQIAKVINERKYVCFFVQKFGRKDLLLFHTTNSTYNDYAEEYGSGGCSIFICVK